MKCKRAGSLLTLPFFWIRFGDFQTEGCLLSFYDDTELMPLLVTKIECFKLL